MERTQGGSSRERGRRGEGLKGAEEEGGRGGVDRPENAPLY